MKLVYVNYSDLNYRGHQNFLLEYIIENQIFDTICPYTREWLETTEFYSTNKNILDKDRLAGYALWKPYIILETMNKIDEGDIVVYMDCGDYPKKNINRCIVNYMSDNDQYFIEGNHTSVNKWWTKRDCFYYMSCDEEKYWNSIQLEDGFIALRKNDFNIELVKEWLEYCCDERIVTDIPNTCGLENLEDFKDHRHDQSILTNLKIKYNLPSENSSLSVNYGVRKYIDWNIFCHVKGEQYGNGSYSWGENGCIV